MASTTPKPFVFVLMPFKDDFDDTYNLGIRAACKEAGTYCERVDEQIYTENMMDRVYNQIAKADIIIADTSGRNPNVFYELGYAHALGKRTILLIRSGEDIPFDVKHSPHVIYKTIASLKNDLKKRIRFFLKNPESQHLVSNDALEYFVNGVSIRTSASVEVKRAEFDRDQREARFAMDLNILNTGDKSLEISKLRFGLVFPKALGRPEQYAHFASLPNETYMVNLTDEFTVLLPQFYLHKSVIVRTPITEIQKTASEIHRCCVRTFTELSTQELPFILTVK